MAERKVEIHRQTKETDIKLVLDLDGKGDATVNTGIPFMDHMFVAFARHGFFDIQIEATGDLQVDYHHLVEDLGLVLGQAIKKAVGDKRGINRYGSFLLPMDDALAQVAVDLCNRAFLVYNVPIKRYFVRDFNVQLVQEFFQALANEAGANVHVNLQYGEEPHHVIEAIFKGFSRALDIATQIDPRLGDSLPSTKGSLS